MQTDAAFVPERSNRPAEQAGVALLLIDVVNAFGSEGSAGLVEAAGRAAPKILALRQRAHEAGVPVIYVNDSFGQANFADTIASCSRATAPGHITTRMLVPVESDHAVLKTNRSGFDATELESLLERVQARTLVLAGFSAEADVLLTARDAHARGYQVLVPSDCTAANSDELTRQALDRMSSEAEARTDESLALDLKALRYADSDQS